MPDTLTRPRRVPRLYLILRDFAISCGVLGELLGLPAKQVRDMLSGHHGLSLARRRRIEAFLKFISVPAAALTDLWSPVLRPSDNRRIPPYERTKYLKGKVTKFSKNYDDSIAMPDPDPVNLLDMEVPVLNRQSLSVDACKVFGFIDKEGAAVDPFWREFKDPVNGEFVFPGYQRAFDAMMLAARQRQIFALVAPPAAGKTFLFQRVRAALRKKGYLLCEPRLLTKSKITEGTLLNSILAEIAGPDFKPKTRIADRCDQIYELLTTDQGMKKVLLSIDEAQELPPLALRCLKRLHDWHYGVYDNLLSIVLIGHPLLKNNLLCNSMVQETGRRTVIHELEPLDSITDFLTWRLRKSLGNNADSHTLFSADGLAAFGVLMGNPLNHHNWRPFIVCTLAAAALERAYRLGERQITEGILREVVNSAQEAV
jgi:type II secretory pathway predicted ATPase ExeA